VLRQNVGPCNRRLRVHGRRIVGAFGHSFRNQVRSGGHYHGTGQASEIDPFYKSYARRKSQSGTSQGDRTVVLGSYCLSDVGRVRFVSGAGKVSWGRLSRRDFTRRFVAPSRLGVTAIQGGSRAS
jgi:hypothetical protein